MAQCFNCGRTDPPVETFFYYNEMTEESGWLCKECFERYKIDVKNNSMVGWVCPVCGRGLSPWISYCPCKVSSETNITY